MAEFVLSLNTVVTQGSDTINKTVYASGDTRLLVSHDHISSGLTSGVLAFDPTKLKAFAINATAANTRVIFAGLSGTVTVTLPQGNFPLVWMSGFSNIANPFLVASGNVATYSIQQLSGFISGTVTFNGMTDGTV